MYFVVKYNVVSIIQLQRDGNFHITKDWEYWSDMIMQNFSGGMHFQNKEYTVHKIRIYLCLRDQATAVQVDKVMDDDDGDGGGKRGNNILH